MRSEPIGTSPTLYGKEPKGCIDWNYEEKVENSWKDRWSMLFFPSFLSFLLSKLIYRFYFPRLLQPTYLSCFTFLISFNQISYSSNELGIKGRRPGGDSVTRLGNIWVNFSCVYLFVCNTCVNFLFPCQATAKQCETFASTTMGRSSSALPMTATSNSGTLRQVDFTALMSSSFFIVYTANCVSSKLLNRRRCSAMDISPIPCRGL